MLRLTPFVRERFEAAPRETGTVHSVFDRAVNIRWHDGRLLTLQGPGPLAAPFAAAVERTADLGRLSPGLPVRRAADGLLAGPLGLDWRGAGLVDASIPAVSSDLGALCALLEAAAPEASRALDAPSGVRACHRLSEGIRWRDSLAFLRGARELLGRGEGLTPAGDDCLVGALAVLHRIAWPPLSSDPTIAATLGADAGTRTTLLGREFVRHAAGGAFSEAVIAVVTARSPGQAARAAARLLGMGATSGADTMAGMRVACRALSG